MGHEAELQQLRSAIEIAFVDAAYPGDDKLISHPCEECFRVRDNFKGTVWKDWTKRDLAEGGGTAPLALFTPEAFRFYLPAYLLRAIAEVVEKKETPIFEGVLFSLADPKRTIGLSEDEATVAARTAEFLRARYSDNDPIQDDFNDAIENLTKQAHRS